MTSGAEMSSEEEEDAAAPPASDAASETFSSLLVGGNPASAPANAASAGLLWSRRELRRGSDPGRAQQLWDAIGAVRSQKQIPAITRMARYMSRFYQIKRDETQRLLDAAVEDNLIKLECKVGTKGHKSGVEEKAYRLPTSDMLPRERHDWYCFHCHAGGEVLLCAGCHRVYHETCLKAESAAAISERKEEDDGDVRQEWFCATCQIAQQQPSTEESSSKKERKDLNHLLNLVCLKLKNKLLNPILLREVPLPVTKAVFEGGDRSGRARSQSPQGEEFPKPDPKEDNAWRASFLLKEQITLEEMEAKCGANQYRILEEFRADAQLIVHNIVIFHGVHSSMADMARQMLRDCVADLREILQCRDCYRYANEHREKYWFCKPCRPFHELVYAKQKGFPYWPAKVMGRRGDGGGVQEVRFFGGYHQKAMVDRQHVRAISVNVHTLQVKRTSLWNKACEELRKHQELLTKCQQNENFLREPYGDPFIGGEIKNQLGGGDEDDSSSEASDAEEPSRNPTTAEVAAPPPPVQAPPPVAVVAFASPPADNKKKKGKTKKLKKEESEDLVSSSSQEMRFIHTGVQTQTKLLKKGEVTAASKAEKNTNEDLRQIIDKMRAEFDQEKKRAVNVATRSLERDLERLKADHATEIEEIAENHKQEVSDVKKKQWCFNCEAEAIYWCCWNTAYCSIECQQQHWHKEHKRNCRRKR